MIQQICEADLSTMIDAIQPILTKVKKDEEDLQMDAIRETLKDQFRAEIKVRKN